MPSISVRRMCPAQNSACDHPPAARTARRHALYYNALFARHHAHRVIGRDFVDDRVDNRIEALTIRIIRRGNEIGPPVSDELFSPRLFGAARGLIDSNRVASLIPHKPHARDIESPSPMKVMLVIASRTVSR